MAGPRSEGTTFAIPSRIALFTAKPVMESLVEMGHSVHVVCPEVLHHEVHDLATSSGGSLISLEDLNRKYRRRHKLHRWLLLAFTHPDFSSSYRGLISTHRPDAGWRFRVLYPLTRPLPKWPHQAVNRRLARIFSRWIRNPFPSRRVVALSKATLPHLLCAEGVDVVTLVESWDHGNARPAGYPSRLVVAWNRSLARDWERYQGDTRVIIGYPFKLGYVIENPVVPRPHRSRPNPGRPLAMYPIGAESRSPRTDWHRDELTLLEAICCATERVGWDLLIKPKPAGVKGEYDCFASRHRHVRIGTELGADWCVDYDLSDDYNRARRRELASVDYVFNCWTTFALDAACAGRPVIQLDLRGRTDIPSLSRAYEHDHIRDYLVRDPEQVLRLEPSRPLAEELAVRLPRIGNRAESFSRALAEWLRPQRPREAALCEIAGAISRI